MTRVKGMTKTGRAGTHNVAHRNKG